MSLVFFNNLGKKMKATKQKCVDIPKSTNRKKIDNVTDNL